jgi:phosphoribosyl 1,2-cyclic phosphate phosphodiesterase
MLAEGATVLKLIILGSAAAEGWPALFCTCDVCREARLRRGKDLRHRTSYRLGDHLQIDWGPDTYAASIAQGLDMSTLTDLVFTHSHQDHFTPAELGFRRPGFSLVPEESTLTVHGAAAVGDALQQTLPDFARFRLAFELVEAYRDHPLCDGVTLTAIPGEHDPSSGPLNFIFDTGDRKILIGHDTGWWSEQTWDFLGGRELDLVVMDCTYGPKQNRGGHLGAPDVLDARQELVARGALAKDCRFVVNHFSHNGGWLHHQLEEFFAPHGIDVGYDGMEL